MAKFSTPKVSILYIDAQGQEVEETVQTTAADQYVFDMLRANKKNLASVNEAPQLWAYILSWAALKRLKKIQDGDFDNWIRTSLQNVEIVQDDQQEEDETAGLVP